MHTHTNGNTQDLIGWTNAAVSCALHCDCESTAGAMSLAFNEESKKKIPIRNTTARKSAVQKITTKGCQTEL